MNKPKLAFFIEDPYHIDFYLNIFKNLDKKKFILLLNNIDKKNNIFNKTINILEDLGINYLNLKNHKNHNFDYLISTMDSNICFFNLFGKKIFFSKKNFFLIKIINFFKINYSLIEKALSQKIIFFPRGMDIKKKYLHKVKEEISDIFFCHSKIDQEILKNETQKETFIIGYPRYNEILSKKNDSQKKNILFLPSVSTLNRKDPNAQIESFFERFENYFQNYNFIFKPHPMFQPNEKIVLAVNNHSIKMLDQDSNLNFYYDIADYIICNNTGPFFSSIFKEKPTLILKEIKNDFHPLIEKIYNKYKNFYRVEEENICSLFKKNDFQKKFWLNQNNVKNNFKEELFKNSPENGGQVCAEYLDKLINEA